MSKAKKQKNANKHRALSAQQTIPYIAMHPDGICQIPGGWATPLPRRKSLTALKKCMTF